MTAANSILEIQDLTVAYQQGDEWLEAVHDVSLRVNRGETYGLVGESGSGKTTLVLAVMQYLGDRGSIIRGEIQLAGLNMRSLTENELRRVWGSQVSLVPQNPQASLNPSLRVGEQLAEIMRHQGNLSKQETRQRALDWLHEVRIADPKRVASSYPHQISGGMQQRVLIAMALSAAPKLLILDEPTTSLDVTTQAVILELIHDLIQGRDMGVLYVTHNLGVIARYCDRVGVMYASELVEEAKSKDLFTNPLHPYTQGLLGSIPKLGDTKDRLQLQAIPGRIPAIGQGPSGCIFRTRCPIAADICTSHPPLYPAGDSRTTRCHRWQEINQEAGYTQKVISTASPPHSEISTGRTGTLELEGVSIAFPVGRSITDLFADRPGRFVRAVNRVSLAIPPGSTLGLVGESGSGKTTIARSIMGLQETSAGSIKLHQVQLPDRLSQRDLDILRQMQMVFQNPQEALNPHLTIGQTLSRPYIRLLGLPREQAKARVGDLLAAVHLPPNFADRYPVHLSGGEIQRVALARAIASNPDLLILDEPISSLDVSVQAAILNLVGELQADHHNSLLFISHNLAVIGYLADQTAVIYVGSLMEISGQGDLFQPPHHPYTEALISAIPQIDPLGGHFPLPLEGEIPDPANLPGGCPFHTRCPRSLGEICVSQSPPWQVDLKTGKKIFCHIPLEELSASQVYRVAHVSSRK